MSRILVVPVILLAFVLMGTGALQASRRPPKRSPPVSKPTKYHREKRRGCIGIPFCCPEEIGRAHV